MIIFGNRLFGKVDQVPGLGYVATRFFHIDYLPLVPYEGWLVYQHNGKTWRGVKIPMSAKSLLVAWGRTAAVVAGVAGIVMAIVLLSGNHPDTGGVAMSILLAAAGWGLFAFSRMHTSVTRASYKRACELAKHAKLGPKGMAALATAYGEAAQIRGFEPLPAKRIAKATATVAPDEPIPLEEIPVDISDFDEDPETDVIPLAEQPRQPLRETRRHG